MGTLHYNFKNYGFTEDGPVAPTHSSPFPQTDLQHIDAFWRAANNLTVGQIYLRDNPLLREPWRPGDGGLHLAGRHLQRALP